MTFSLRNKFLLLFFIDLVCTVSYHVNCNSIEAIEGIDQQDIMISSEDEDSFNELKMALGLLVKYQQLLHDNMFQSSAQKKMAINKYKNLMKTLANYFNESEINKETVEQLNAELNKKSKSDGSNKYLKSRPPFKWG